MSDHDAWNAHLTTIVVWAGRYPVSAAAEQLVQRAGEYAATDGDAVRNLAAKLDDFYDRIPETVWTLATGERAETVKRSDQQWEASIIVGEDVVRSVLFGDGIAAYRQALEWRREYEGARGE
jgi:hypothetical protein